ncbi:hypothetical protein NW762_012667 [Fusarium torreyae]|uniref:Cytochrome P450 monooxygenase n=1 Tax=Fusarium torreyae TaxID=1237075 RepID=A0A9W8RMC7_9HYPO|nr:hypothetical protein NW762_012667 [Fusarium torreyae]
MDLNYSSSELITPGFLSGCVMHILFYRRGEWDLLATRLVQTYIAIPLIVIGAMGIAKHKALLNTTNLSTAAASVLLFEFAHIVGIFSSILAYRTLFHRLNRFPGPFCARISNLYPTYLRTKNVQLYEEVEELHQKYGDFVRLGASELSIVHPKAVEAIYSNKSPCTKGPFYNVLHPRTPVHHVRTHKEHAVRRKPWDRAFSSKALRDYEPRVTQYTSQLLDRLSELQGTPINASEWFNFYSFDVMGDLAFGKSFDMLRGGVKHYFMISLHESMKMVGYVAHMTWIFPFLKMIPAVDAETKKFWAWCESQVQERSKSKPDNPDVFSWILEEYERNPKTKQAKLNLDAEAYLIAVAGSDTTAASLTSLFFELGSNPSQIVKLRKEVDEYFDQRDHAESSSLATLTHLNACIDEALRLHPPVPSGMQRVTPPEGLMIGNTMVPGNTIVQVPLHTVHRGMFSS